MDHEEHPKKQTDGLFLPDNFSSILSIIPEKSEFTEMLTTFFITGGVVKLVWDFIVNSDED